jgi:hypothetical protein
MCDDEHYIILDEDDEEIFCMTSSYKKIFIRTYEPYGYINIEEAKKFSKALNDMISKLER